jgi:hypothetical protein
MEVITPSDIEKAVKTHLIKEYAERGVVSPVSSRVPDKKPPRFTVVNRAGGYRPGLVTDAARIEFACYAPTEQEAFDLASITYGIVHAMHGSIVEGVVVSRVRTVGQLANRPHTPSLPPRYRFYVEIDNRMAVE